MLAEEGVRVDRGTPGEVERRGIGWSADTQTAVTTLLVMGTGVAIKTAVARFRKRFPKAKVEVDGPDDGGFLD